MMTMMNQIRFGNLTIKIKTKDDIERNVNIFNEEKVKSLQNDLKKNQIIVVTGNYSQTYHNINAQDIKIQIDKKQLLNQQNITPVQVDTSNNVPNNQVLVSSVGFADVFN